jgi:hypothetical protein
MLRKAPMNDSSVRKCKVCGVLFFRRVWIRLKRVQWERPCVFEKRDHCSRACAFALVKRARDAVKPLRLCAFCEQPMPTRTPCGAVKQTNTCSAYCGTKLWALGNLDKYPSKKCERCKVDLIRRRRETPTMWLKRRFCGYSCSAKSR